MPIVYVHGIGNRAGARFDDDDRLREGLFHRVFAPVVFADHPRPAVLAPYWGRFGADPRRSYASLPSGGQEALGADDDCVQTVAASLTARGEPDSALLGLARESLPDAIDALYTVVGPGGADPAALVDFAEAATRYLQLRESLYPREPEPVRYPWLVQAADDLAFVDQLISQVNASAATAETASTESLGIRGDVRDRLARGVRRLRQAVVGVPTSVAVAAARRATTPRIAVFLGDVLTYLAHRGPRDQPGPIVTTVAAALERASAESRPGEPTVVIAHSMGGNIVHDLLSYYRTDLKVDVLVTVGSQVGLFEELNLFQTDRPDNPDPATRAAAPPRVTNWINVVDLSDPLAFRAAPVFEKAEDYDYPSGAIWAHSAYLRQPNFYRRLAGRVARVLQ
jgi:hypothetical protein